MLVQQETHADLHVIRTLSPVHTGPVQNLTL